jgi:hypothetical protein
MLYRLGAFFLIADMYCSEVVKQLQMLQVDKIYPIVRVHKLPSCHGPEGQKNFIVRLWEAHNRQGRYILPLHDIFPENEIIQFINGSLYMELIFQGLYFSGDPVVFNKCPNV